MDHDTVIIMPDSLAMNVSAANFKGISLFILLIVIILIFSGMIFAIRASKRQYMVDPDYVPPALRKTVRAGIPRVRSKYANSGESHTEDGKAFYPDNGTDIDNPAICDSKPYRKWHNNKCLCMAPFYGGSCEQETHGQNYYPVGNYQFEDTPFPVNRKAFPFQGASADSQTTCEQQCNQNSQCIGYQYQNNDITKGLDTGNPTGLCYLLTKPPTGFGNGYSELLESNTYMVKGERPFFPNEVFLYKGNLRNRFWTDNVVNTSEYRFIKMGINQVNRVQWPSTGLINDGEYTIVVANQFFTIEEAKRISQLRTIPSGWYVARSGQEYNPHYYITSMGDSYWIAAIDDQPPIKIKIPTKQPIKIIPPDSEMSVSWPSECSN